MNDLLKEWIGMHILGMIFSFRWIEIKKFMNNIPYFHYQKREDLMMNMDCIYVILALWDIGCCLWDLTLYGRHNEIKVG